ncbi:MAG: GIY-YIG nuclease family protein [Oscillospiraceae bacterium]|nr:GIY-YIG nuclease family protein [Oscillospiraceae bacterium]
MKQWCVYILRCGDGTLYTGMTDDFPRRLEQHRAGRGAKYTRGRAPLEPVYRESCASKPEALKREYAIKRLTREKKLALIAQQQYITGEDA